jgi:hypothetical protein
MGESAIPEPSPDERRWWEMQLGIALRTGGTDADSPEREKPVHRSFHLTRPIDEHGWWELQLGKRLRRTARD